MLPDDVPLMLSIVVKRRGKATVQEIVDDMHRFGSPLGYRTVLKRCQALANSGLAHFTCRRPYVIKIDPNVYDSMFTIVTHVTESQTEKEVL